MSPTTLSPPDDVPADGLVDSGPSVEVALDLLDAAVDALQTAQLDAPAANELLAVRRLERIRRRLDAGTDRTVAHLEASAAFSLDGHRNTRSAIKHLGRLPGSEALGRIRTARALRELPSVAAAYAAGRLPTGHVRAIARAVSNPRVHEFLEVADPVFAEQAASLDHDEFCAWLAEWERLADADGAGEAAEERHERRKFAFLRNDASGAWDSVGHHGDLEGAAMAELLDIYERAEFEDDWAAARAEHGKDARVEHLPRTSAQRRADALFEIFRRAGAAPADARSPEPLVNIVVDQDTFDDELRRAAGETVLSDPDDTDGRRCHTMGGHPLPPSAVLAAAMVGHVRRVVVDAAGTVTDLGRKRRLFTGSSREAALVQAALRGPGGLRCLWPGCDGRGGCLEVDHREPAAHGGPTDVDNSDAYCGSHNRIKERGFRPERQPDGNWVIHRPDGTRITPSI